MRVGEAIPRYLPRVTTTHWRCWAPAPIGQDHLATRAVCEALYAQLLPGITNVTDRARYYSFYPWLVWALEGRRLDDEALRKMLRRAECLLTLIGIAHGNVCGADGRYHAERLVGRDTLGPAFEPLLRGGELALDTYAGDEGSRYFKARWGGLEQYYRGAEEELGVLSRDTSRKVGLGVTPDRGVLLARAFAAAVDGDAFLRVLDRGHVDRRTLDGLAAFCPCSPGHAEREALLDLFLDRPGSQPAPGGHARSRSLALLLDLAAPGGPPVDTDGFRAAVYTGTRPGGDTWSLPDRLSETRAAWAVYQRNELLSLATQALFWAALTDALGYPTPAHDARAWSTRFAARYAGTLPNSSQPFATWRAAVASTLPVLNDRDNPGHELALAARLRDRARRGARSDADRAEVVDAALRLLTILVIRDEHAGAYGGLAVPPDWLAAYPINLITLRSAAAQWDGRTVAEVLAWLAHDWGLATHLRVALRKLRFTGNDTFRVRSTEAGLVSAAWSETNNAVYSTPRLVQSAQILTDLGALRPVGRAWLRTPTGDTLLERLRG